MTLQQKNNFRTKVTKTGRGKYLPNGPLPMVHWQWSIESDLKTVRLHGIKVPYN